ncbi:hypothetical protein PPERSA_08164 [Pseudocohnilembus persalinus]|uniref:Peptidase S28 n=1 Tax=Pseudocohnilembus persalinus TaxID=266149 RepID=A0A0V0R3C0_PSEPJ|nr:hypothetical protein PPERSA_08164 [Pseudocohnilembus persalinus]|eukprot:KRX08961.1 hypothetical protein PPERSA_08164 [Pseudocohnilembus persalinus]
MKLKSIYIFLIVISFVFAQYRTKNLQKLLKKRLNHFQAKNKDEYKVYYHTQKIDHLQFNNDSTFQQKYLVRDQFYQEGGPIFFYCGNEGPVEMFYENAGFLNTDLAKEFNALIVYMEHRYYGDSMPFGNEENSYKKENLVYLTSLQALYDYVTFLDDFKAKNFDYNVPVIAFGGSYGGMLATWMRLKFPNSIDGALGASAPIAYFQNRVGLNLGSFYEIATVNFEQDGCDKKIKETFDRLQDMYYTANQEDFEELNSSFNLCTPITSQQNITSLINWINEGYAYMAMTNYPYETEFLKYLPAWPANTSCNALEDVNINSSNKNLFNAINLSVSTYYNFDGKEKCNEIFEDNASDQDMAGWDIQACAELVMPMDSGDSMFNFFMWDGELYSQNCYDQWGLKTNYDWALNFYGGKTDEEFQYSSNIFLSNGELDPWSGGGIYYENNLDFDYVLMPMCAHHLDLRSPNPADPIYVKKGRNLEREAIYRWIQQKSNSVNYTKQKKQLQNEIKI